MNFRTNRFFKTNNLYRCFLKIDDVPQKGRRENDEWNDVGREMGLEGAHVEAR